MSLCRSDGPASVQHGGLATAEGTTLAGGDVETLCRRDASVTQQIGRNPRELGILIRERGGGAVTEQVRIHIVPEAHAGPILQYHLQASTAQRRPPAGQPEMLTRRA
jgi:hypothetical protein